MLSWSNQKRRDCRAVCIRPVGARTSMLVNLDVAKHGMAGLHAAINKPNSSALYGRTGRDVAGIGSFRRTVGNRSAVQINVIEVVNPAGSELTQSLQRAASRDAS